MSIKIVTIKDTLTKDSINYARVEVFENDLHVYPIYTMPGFECIPLKNEKCLLLPLDKNGELAVIGIPLKTDIDNGEIRLSSKSNNGMIMAQIHLKNDGNIEIGVNGLKKLVTETVLNVFNTHTHSVILQTLVTSPPQIAMNDTVLTKKTKAK